MVDNPEYWSKDATNSGKQVRFRGKKCQEATSALGLNIEVISICLRHG